jgi:L-threonate 2-dehydrogenase
MSVDNVEKIAFAGLGAMGMGMATSLLRAGFSVQGYDINVDAVAEFARQGGTGASSVEEAVEDADALLVIVLSADQAEDVLFGAGNAARSMSQGTLVVLSSTVEPAYAVSVASRLAVLGIEYLDAPVSGGVARAAEGNLSVMASGSRTAFQMAAPILNAVAENVYDLGDEPGQGSAMKLVNQILAGIHIAAAAEAVAFGARLGIDPKRMYEVICNSAGASWMFENRVPHILADDYTPYSAIDIWVKDFGIIMDAGKSNRFPLPISAAAQQLYMMAAAAGFGRLDDASVVKVFEKLAGFRVASHE